MGNTYNYTYHFVKKWITVYNLSLLVRRKLGKETRTRRKFHGAE